MSNFVKVASVSDLAAGAAKTVDVNGRAVALFNVNGRIYALDNTCLHRGGPLGDGSLEGEVVTCPWHGWQYKVTTGENCTNSAVKVASYQVEVEGNDIKVAV